MYYALLPVKELTIAERIDSSHIPVELSINTKQNDALGATNNNNGRIRIVWKSEKNESFLQAVKLAQIQEQINNGTSIISTYINMALKIFNKCMLALYGNKNTFSNYECVTTRRTV